MAARKPVPGAWYTLGNLHHNGRAYAPGDAFPGADCTADEQQIEALRACGLLSAVPPVEDGPPADAA